VPGLVEISQAGEVFAGVEGQLLHRVAPVLVVVRLREVDPPVRAAWQGVPVLALQAPVLSELRVEQVADLVCEDVSQPRLVAGVRVIVDEHEASVRAFVLGVPTWKILAPSVVVHLRRHEDELDAHRRLLVVNGELLVVYYVAVGRVVGLDGVHDLVRDIIDHAGRVLAQGEAPLVHQPLSEL
jgi:hypothetical protein